MQLRSMITIFEHTINLSENGNKYYSVLHNFKIISFCHSGVWHDYICTPPPVTFASPPCDLRELTHNLRCCFASNLLMCSPSFNDFCKSALGTDRALFCVLKHISDTALLLFIAGDMMGNVLEDIDKLVQMPFGCGEQNMITTVPNIYALTYLNAINDVPPGFAEKAKGYMRAGGYSL